jgi:hypothetical protein
MTFGTGPKPKSDPRNIATACASQPERYPFPMRHPLRFSLALLSLAGAHALAWNDYGHMVVVDIASRSLSYEAKQKMDRLLRIGGSAKTNELLTAACWADDIKSRENGPWHYINYHFRPDGKPSSLKPLEENVVWAINKFAAAIRSGQTPESEKADALRFLLHFVGDIHQPLHCVARDTETSPEGDRGGNDFKLLPPRGMKPAPRNLHFLWDMGGGLFGEIERPLTAKCREAIGETAELAIKLNPEMHIAGLIAQKDPAAWAREGLEIAKKSVYGFPENTEPPKSYLDLCQSISLKRVALAGYRLSGLLNELFGR